MQRKVSTLQPISVHRKAHKIRQQVTSADLSNHCLQVKTRSAGEYKVFPPRRLCQMIRAVSRQKDAERQNSQELLNLYCLLKNQTYATALYPRSQANLIIFILTFLDIVSSDMFFWIPIRSMMRVHGRKL